MIVTRRLVLTLGATALAASGLAGLAGGMLHPVVDGRSHSVASMTAEGGPPAYLLLYGGAVLLMLGLPAAYAWLAPRVGLLGLAGFGLYMVGNALSAQSHLVVEGFVARDIVAARPDLVPADGTILDAPSFVTLQTVGGLVFVAGVLLVGVALLVHRPVPRWIGVAFVLSALGVLVPLPEAPVLTGLQVELFEAIGTVGLAAAMIRAPRRSTRTADRGAALAS
ncbi:hypothetical protein ACFPK1_23790 [Actinomycetospora rhizophila]|uniref:DUF4386 domain-containing protein n=1 Tax=Actinomycetospora rhizophila TaxID=1416876 RepID=A0ABV9ZJA6_9PSEU